MSTDDILGSAWASEDGGEGNTGSCRGTESGGEGTSRSGRVGTVNGIADAPLLDAGGTVSGGTAHLVGGGLVSVEETGPGPADLYPTA